ncbi:putative reverse transcriptase domain-containing protein, partial [Tanacetum coccineum]
CTLNLLNRSFPIDLMVIELGSFDIIIGRDWLSRYDAAISCGEKKVRIPLEGRTLVTQADRNTSRSYSRCCTCGACAISFSTIRNEGVVQATARVVGERFYSIELVTVGSSGIVCEEEGWIIPNMH